MTKKRMKNNRRRAAIVVLWLLIAAVTSAARRPQLNFLKSVELPNIGLKIKLMPRSLETPLPPPTVYTYTFTRQGKSWKTDMYSPVELWRQSQHAGKWVDKHDNTLVIATITRLFPKDFAREHVSRENYEKKITEPSNSPDQWTHETLRQWAADFTGAEKAEAQTMRRRPSCLRNLVSFNLKGQSAHRMAYAFRLSRSAAGQHKAPLTWFFVLFNVNPAIDPEKAYKSIREKFFTSVTSSKASLKKTIGPSKKFQRHELTRDSEKSPEFLASRDQVANSIKNMRNWWYVETENYIILSNLKTRYRIMVNNLQAEIEYLRAAYEQFIPAHTEITAVSVVRVFGAPEEYLNYIGSKYEWSGGLWIPSKKELVIKPIDWGGSKEQRDRVRQVTYHEAFHQYLFYAMDQIETSVWFNEGHAVFFENAVIRNKKFTVSEDEYKFKTLETMIKEDDIDIEKMLHMSYENFYAKDDKTRENNYTLAWAIIYYLRKAAGLEQPPRYAAILDKYPDALWESKHCDKATDMAFEGINLDTFRQDFVKFWKSKNKRGRAKRNRIFQF